MYSSGDTPKGWVAPFGHPGIKACSRLPRAFRSVPRPSSPPGAKASTRCPSHAPNLSQPEPSPRPPCRIRTNPIRRTRHAQEPSTPLPCRHQATRRAQRTPNPTASHSITQHTHSNASEPCSHVSNQACLSTCSGSDTHANITTDPPSQPRTHPRHTAQGGQSHPRRPARPETHQNLIHNP